MWCIINVMKNNSETGHGGREWGWVYLSRDWMRWESKSCEYLREEHFRKRGEQVWVERGCFCVERIARRHWDCSKSSAESLVGNEIDQIIQKNFEGEQILWVDTDFLSFKRFLLKYS